MPISDMNQINGIFLSPKYFLLENHARFDRESFIIEIRFPVSLSLFYTLLYIIRCISCQSFITVLTPYYYRANILSKPYHIYIYNIVIAMGTLIKP